MSFFNQHVDRQTRLLSIIAAGSFVVTLFGPTDSTSVTILQLELLLLLIYTVGLIMSKYKLQSTSTNVGSIKKSIWECFANKAYENGKIQFCNTTS